MDLLKGTERYVVDTVFDNDGVKTVVNVYTGNDRARAIATCNFWDAKQDTYVTDRLLLKFTDFDAWLAERIEIMAANALKKLEG